MPRMVSGRVVPSEELLGHTWGSTHLSRTACRHRPGTRAPELEEARILRSRQPLLGFAAAARTYAIDHAIGVAVAG